MEIKLPYDEKALIFSLPEHWQLISVAEPKNVAALPENEIKTIIKESFSDPIGIDPLDKLVKPSHNVVIVIDDISRPTPSSLLIEPLIDFLIKNIRIQAENITIIFGLGVHREMNEEDAKIKLGSKVLELIKWENHDCYNNLSDLGKKSSYGTSIQVNRTFMDADFTIAVGLIEPHLWAGYSGGYKAIIPGIVGVDTIVHNHHLLMKRNVQVGKIEG